MYSNKRKYSDKCLVSNKRHETQNQILCNTKSFSNSLDALNYLRSIFPIEKFDNKIPIIVWRHQLYALFTNRTEIDKQVNSWCESGFIRLFRLGSTINTNEVAIVLMDDFQEFVDKYCDKTTITERFLKKVVHEKPKSIYTSDELKNEYKFNDQNITELVRSGLLATHRSVGSWLLSIPNAGKFVKSFDIGKKALISMIKKSKFREISKNDIFRRKLPKDAKFSIEYHVYDLIGSDIVNCVETSSDTILRM